MGGETGATPVLHRESQGCFCAPTQGRRAHLEQFPSTTKPPRIVRPASSRGKWF